MYGPKCWNHSIFFLHFHKNFKRISLFLLLLLSLTLFVCVCVHSRTRVAWSSKTQKNSFFFIVLKEENANDSFVNTWVSEWLFVFFIIIISQVTLYQPILFFRSQFKNYVNFFSSPHCYTCTTSRISWFFSRSMKFIFKLKKIRWFCVCVWGWLSFSDWSIVFCNTHTCTHIICQTPIYEHVQMNKCIGCPPIMHIHTIRLIFSVVLFCFVPSSH